MDPKQLQRALETVKPAITNKGNLPIINHVLVEQNGHLSITATDLELWVKTWVDEQGEDFAAMLDPGNLLSLAKSGGGDILLTPPVNGILSVESGSGITKMSAYVDVDDFPSFPDTAERGRDIETKSFIKSVEKAMKSAATDENRFGLNGVFFDGKAGVLVGTNGHKLTTVDVDWLDKDTKAVVPAKKLKKAIQAIKKAKEPLVHVGFNENHMVISSVVVTIAIRLMDTEYPDYHKVIGEKPHTAVTVDKADLLYALKTVKPMTSTRNKAVAVWCESSRVFFRVDHPDLGFGQTWIPCESSVEIPEPTAIDIDLLMGLVRDQDSDKVTLHLAPESTCYVDDALIMPIRDSAVNEPEGFGKDYVPLPPKVETAKPVKVKKALKPKKAKTVKVRKIVKKDKPVDSDIDVKFKKIWINEHNRVSKTGKTYTMKGHWRTIKVKVKVDVKKAA